MDYANVHHLTLIKINVYVQMATYTTLSQNNVNSIEMFVYLETLIRVDVYNVHTNIKCQLRTRESVYHCIVKNGKLLPPGTFNAGNVTTILCLKMDFVRVPYVLGFKTKLDFCSLNALPVLMDGRPSPISVYHPSVNPPLIIY